MSKAHFGWALALMALAATAGHAQGYKKTIPDSLASKAKVSEDSAARIAMKRVPKGTIQSAELEKEKGRLVYSYDLQVPGRTGMQEVIVDARTGHVVRSFHESATTEKKEATMAKSKAATPKPKKP